MDNAVGTITLLDTALLATAGVSFAVGVAPMGATLIGLVGLRTAWRWHRDSIVAAADRTLTDSVQTYHTVKALPQTAKRIATVVQERTQTVTPSKDVLTALASKTHLLVVGHTGGGKSVLLHNLSAHLSGNADVLMCDVDAIAGRYPGYRVVGAGDDYASIEKALELVRSQVEKRRAARAEGTRSFKPMWLFIDEAHDVFATVDGARELFIDIVRRGRKLNVHAVVGTQDSQVRTLGLEGQSKTLINLARIDVALTDQGRGATIDGVTHPIPTMPSPDDMVVAGHIGNEGIILPSHTTPQDQGIRPVLDQAERPTQTALDHGNDTLLELLLGGGLSQSNAVDRHRPPSVLDRSTSLADQGIRPGLDHHTMLTDQATIDMEIRSKMAYMSKNKVWEWLREKGVTNSKGKAMEIINQAMMEENCDQRCQHDAGICPP